MRILHTSDLHLGRTFFGFDLRVAHTALAEHLVDVCAERHVDLLIIAGDVYDRAIPGPAAVAAFDTLLARLRHAGVAVLATSGNHDSFMRLGFGRELFDDSGIHLRTRLADLVRPALIGPSDAHVAVYGIPYLEPALVADRLGVPRTHAAVLERAMEIIHDDHSHNHPGTRLVVAAHAFVTGSGPSESERQIDLGGVGSVPAATFASTAYTALGHLHRPQDPLPTVRYSGSPLAFGFDEGPKRLLQIDVPPDGPAQVEAIAVPCFVSARTLTGTLAEVLGTPDDGSFVEVRLTDPARSPQALPRLKQAFERLVRYEWTNLPTPTATAPTGSTQARTDTQVFTDFMRTTTGQPATAEETALFDTALAQALREDA